MKKYVDTRANTSNVAAGLLVLTSASMLLGLEVLDSLVSTCTHVDNKTPRSSLPPCNAGKNRPCKVFRSPSPPCLVQAPFHAPKALHGASKSQNMWQGAEPKTVSLAACDSWSVGVCHLLYGLISVVNPALSIIALSKWILPNQVFYWIPAAVGTSRSYNNSHPSCYNNSFLPVKQPGDLAKVSQTPRSLETVATDFTSETSEDMSWNY